MGSDDLSPTIAPIVDSGREEVLEQTLEHARKGQGNAQDIIKLIDTKNSVFIGLSTLAAGFVFGLLKWSLELPRDKGNLVSILTVYPSARFWLLLPVGVTFLAALFCIGACVWSTIAHARPEHLRRKFTVLFPAYPERSAESARGYFHECMEKGMSRADILAEYEDQLRVLGLILGKKLKHHQRAAVAFLIRLVTVAVVFVGFLLGSLLGSNLNKLPASTAGGQSAPADVSPAPGSPTP